MRFYSSKFCTRTNMYDNTHINFLHYCFRFDLKISLENTKAYSPGLTTPCIILLFDTYNAILSSFGLLIVGSCGQNVFLLFLQKSRSYNKILGWCNTSHSTLYDGISIDRIPQRLPPNTLLSSRIRTTDLCKFFDNNNKSEIRMAIDSMELKLGISD